MIFGYKLAHYVALYEPADGPSLSARIPSLKQTHHLVYSSSYTHRSTLIFRIEDWCGLLVLVVVRCARTPGI